MSSALTSSIIVSVAMVTQYVVADDVNNGYYNLYYTFQADVQQYRRCGSYSSGRGTHQLCTAEDVVVSNTYQLHCYTLTTYMYGV